ncbi:MAG: hypothetical protein JO252_10960 [Planctomycetaceae bacterium]|nr:hypothetical protein [Acidimicrobiia bacterium]MBV8266835.1 hypothetical protein [Planctomycetaceae bacterium]MBV8554445.1 hypothetical protein [Planctomycetaceae bacterium]
MIDGDEVPGAAMSLGEALAHGIGTQKRVRREALRCLREGRPERADECSGGATRTGPGATAGELRARVNRRLEVIGLALSRRAVGEFHVAWDLLHAATWVEETIRHGRIAHHGPTGPDLH